jgi:hypothetical protein
MVELKGSLNGIGLPAIVQLIGELHHSGSLQLAKGTAHGLLGFDDGRLVLASYEHDTGLRALAACARDLSDGEFTFIEGPLSGERTLDLTYADAQRQLNRLATGYTPQEDVVTIAAPVPQQDIVTIATPVPQPHTESDSCPLLGFADDRSRHYSRPTALHRCFASGAASLVTAGEQRELCLADRYPACPRFRNSALATSAPPAPAEPQPEVPAGVAARMAALSTMRVAYTNTDQDTPAPPLQDLPSPQTEQSATPRRFRNLQLLVGGTLLGIIVLLAAVVLVIPSFNSGLIPRPATPEPSQAFQLLPTPTRAAPPTAAPTLQPTLAPTIPPTLPVAAKPQNTATTPPRPTPNSQARSLLDLRLADGPARGWRDNPPYVGWADGAYRLQARQAARFVAIGVPTDEPLGDMIVTATFRKTGGPPGGGYGLVVRDQGPDPRDGVNQNMNAYVLETGDLGEFGVWRRDGDHWFDLVPWTRSGAVRPGGSPNDLTVRATGDRLVFSVNGVEVAQVQDDTLLAGGIGMFVGGDFNEVAVDRFLVQVPN